MRTILLGCFLITLIVGIPKNSAASDENGSKSSPGAAETRLDGLAPNAASDSASNVAAEIEQLRQLLDQQSAELAAQRAVNEKQFSRLTALESELANMRGAGAASVSPENPSDVSNLPKLETTPAPAAQNLSSAPKSDSSPLFFKIGKANFTPYGFLDFTTVVRSKTVGSGIGTTFGTIPYAVPASYPAAGLTELRMSSQNSQIALKVDSQVGRAKILGDLETDLLGNNATTMYVTSNSATLRLRLAFVDVSYGKWEFLGGQDWSLMTPNRKGILPMTADVFYSIDADSNYQLGVVWARQAQLRIVYHPSKSWALGFSAENPQQFIGSALNLPSAFTNAQADTNGAATGTNTNTPNVLPDMIAKIAYDTKWRGKTMHFDTAGMVRTFKINSFAAATSTAGAVNANATALGDGFSFDSNLELFRDFHLIENAYWSEGGGRYVLGLAPDFVVRPANNSGAFTISPEEVASWVGGVEWQITPMNTLYGYYSGVYADRQVFAGASCGTSGLCGYGYAGSPNTNNRTIQESTFGINRTIWSSPEFGKLVVRTQVSYLNRRPWSVAAGTPASANLIMGYAALKYVLP